MLICAAACCMVGKADCIEINQLLPDEFTVTQHWFSLTNDFSIDTKEYKLGSVHRKLFSWSLVQYDFLDNDSELQATGKMRWLSWGATFDVFDSNEQSLGRVEEKFSWFFPTFNFISPSNRIQAEATLNFWRTNYTVTDPVTKEVIAIMHRDFFRLKDDWTVKIVNQDLFVQKELDPRLFIIVMAFQSDREEWQRQYNRLKNQHNDDFVARAVVNGSDDNSENAENDLSEQLDKYREILATVEPTKEDYEFVDQLVASKFKTDREVSEEEAELNSIEKEFAMILPLLETDELSKTQKSALVNILEQHLESIE